MNRIALHQSTVHPLDPIELVALADAAGLDSIGLRVAAVAETQQWWAKGIGSPMLHALIPALLASRVTVLDVGRVELGPELRVLDSQYAYVRVLELGVRLGAQFVTARAGAGSTSDAIAEFAQLAALAERYQLQALITVVPGTAIGTLEQAQAAVAGTAGGVVLDVSPRSDTPSAVEEAVVELGAAVGYVRVPAAALSADAAPGLLATLPPQVPVAIGTSVAGESERLGGTRDELADRVRSLRAAVDLLLRHPQAMP